MYMLQFYVPLSHVEPVKAALFLKGAGKLNNYDSCCWQTLGEGQFRPLAGSQPFIGRRDILEKIPECKVEMVCGDECISDVVKELMRVHPYEEPAYAAWKVQSHRDPAE